MAKIKVNKAKLSKSPKKKVKIKAKIQRKPKVLGLEPSERRWETLAQKLSDKKEIIADYLELAKDKTKEKIHDLSFRISKYVEKDEYGTSKLSTHVNSMKMKIQDKIDRIKDSNKKPDPLEIQRFEGEGGRVREPKRTSQELE